MKIKEFPLRDDEDENYLDDTPEEKVHRTFNNIKTSRSIEIDDLDTQLCELESYHSSRFNRKKHREIEAHRQELIRAQKADEKERIRMNREARKEEKKQLRWQKKAIVAETTAKLAEEHQRETLIKDRQRRAIRRKIDRVSNLILKGVCIFILVIGISCFSSQSARDKVAVTLNNFFDYVGVLLEDSPLAEENNTSVNEAINKVLKPFGKSVDKSGTYTDSNSRNK